MESYPSLGTGNKFTSPSKSQAALMEKILLPPIPNFLSSRRLFKFKENYWTQFQLLGNDNLKFENKLNI